MKSHHSDGLTAVDVDVFLHGSVAVALREYVGGAHVGDDTILPIDTDRLIKHPIPYLSPSAPRFSRLRRSTNRTLRLSAVAQIWKCYMVVTLILSSSLRLVLPTDDLTSDAQAVAVAPPFRMPVDSFLYFVGLGGSCSWKSCFRFSV